MPRWKAFSFVAAGVVLCTLVGAFTGGSLVAQSVIKAVLVKDVDNPIRQPVFLEGRYFADPADYYTTGEYAIDYTVPPGKRLVVEFISVAGVDTPISDATLYEARIGVPGGVGPLDAFYLGMPHFSGAYRVAQPLRLYYSAGTQFRVGCSRFPVTAATGLGRCSAIASGYLVDVAY